MPPHDEKHWREAARLHESVVSLRAARLAMRAKVEYMALTLRLDEARKAERPQRGLTP